MTNFLVNLARRGAGLVDGAPLPPSPGPVFAAGPESEADSRETPPPTALEANPPPAVAAVVPAVGTRTQSMMSGVAAASSASAPVVGDQVQSMPAGATTSQPDIDAGGRRYAPQRTAAAPIAPAAPPAMPRKGGRAIERGVEPPAPPPRSFDEPRLAMAVRTSMPNDHKQAVERRRPFPRVASGRVESPVIPPVAPRMAVTHVLVPHGRVAADAVQSLVMPQHVPSRAPSIPAVGTSETTHVEVRIGRIEVRAVTDARPTRTTVPPRPAPKLSLEDYLKQRERGRP